MRIPLQPSVLALMSFSRSAPMECPCPGGWLKIWSVGFTYCTVTHRSPADNDIDLWITVTALGPLLSGHLASYEYVTGSLQAFFKISLLELFGTSVLNRKRLMTQSHLYSSIKKLYQYISLAGRSIHQDLNLVKERRGGLMVPGSLHFALCAELARHRTDPIPSSGKLRSRNREKEESCPSALSLSPAQNSVLSFHILAEISPHVATGRLISVSCGAKAFVPALLVTLGG